MRGESFRDTIRDLICFAQARETFTRSESLWNVATNEKS